MMLTGQGMGLSLLVFVLTLVCGMRLTSGSISGTSGAEAETHQHAMRRAVAAKMLTPTQHCALECGRRADGTPKTHEPEEGASCLSDCEVRSGVCFKIPQKFPHSLRSSFIPLPVTPTSFILPKCNAPKLLRVFYSTRTLLTCVISWHWAL